MYKTMTVLYCLMLVLCGHSYKIEHDNSNSEQPELQENLILKLELKPLSDNILNEDETTVSRVKRSCLSKLFNVSCYKYCPKTKTNDWTYLEAYHSCQNKYNWSTFHCAKNEFGKFVEACAESVICHIGEEPIIYFVKDRKIYAKIKCEPCSSGRYNPNEAMISYDYSQCPKVRRECVPSLGLIECGESGISERTWTDRKCRCNIRDNYLPQDEEPNKCTDDYSFHCYEYPPCQVTSDGKEQEYLSSNYSCAPKCGDGFYPRTLDTDECIPIPTIDSNTTEENITGSTVEATTHGTTTNTTRHVTETTNAIVTVTVTHGTKGTKEESGGLSEAEIVGICIGCVFGLVLLIYLLVGIYYFCTKKRDMEEKRGCCGIISVLFAIICWYYEYIQNTDSSNTKKRKGRQEEQQGQTIGLLKVELHIGNTGSLKASGGLEENGTPQQSVKKDLIRDDMKTVLNRCISDINRMNSRAVIEEITKKEMFTETQRNDLWHMIKTCVPSEVNKEIMDHVQRDVVKNYDEFKQCLENTHCEGHLLREIEKNEDKVLKEKQNKLESTNGNEINHSETSEEDEVNGQENREEG